MIMASRCPGIEELLSLKNEKTHTYYTYCCTDVKLKNFTYIWNLVDFWTAYEFIQERFVIHEANRGNPFDISMETNRKEEKVIFHVKNTEPLLKGFRCHVSLPSNVTENKRHTLSCTSHDGELIFEVKWSFLVDEAEEFVLYDRLRVVFKIVCIEYILSSYIGTEVSHHNESMDTNDTELSEPFNLVVFQGSGWELCINKQLLCAKSEYFGTKSLDKNADENVIILTPDVPLRAVQLFSDFIHRNATSALMYVEINMVFALFNLASKYRVKDLQVICEQRLKEHLLLKPLKNKLEGYDSLEILRFAYDNEAKDLLKFTVDFVALHVNDYIGTELFSDLMQNYPELLALLKVAKSNTAIE